MVRTSCDCCAGSEKHERADKQDLADTVELRTPLVIEAAYDSVGDGMIIYAAAVCKRLGAG